jgi:polyhydroxybutyrate depolymerase
MRWHWLAAVMVVLVAATVMACSGGGAGPKAHSSTTGIQPEPTRSRLETTPGPRRRGPVVPAIRSAGCTATPHATGSFIESLETDAGDREYRLYVPPGYRGGRATALVLNFHGYGQTAAQQEAYSGLVPVADANGFILVTPEGSGDPQGWNITGVYAESGVDDVAFAGALVAHLSDALCLDARRIYATGHSNGAEMASELACFEPQLLAAIAPVSGALYQGCDGTGTPIVSFQGTDDFNVLYEWSAEAMDEWAAHNGCGDSVSAQVAEHVTDTTWQSCAGGAVEFYVIDGGGHTWPGADPTLGGVGETTAEINASALIWRFFAAHPRP